MGMEIASCACSSPLISRSQTRVIHNSTVAHKCFPTIVVNQHRCIKLDLILYQINIHINTSLLAFIYPVRMSMGYSSSVHAPHRHYMQLYRNINIYS